ncbi:hypothetical protein SLEP1_g3638 [Rubroshorea leprosula]|uniref:Uncharacterized protein n=1 Tax=Rubroshorea leprosula TaxID=152421 RepID=A0AAV5HUA5_9ROSI|nr:hypothetical protein SLEP1_g3638 [Rubroshorea leprosula]
MLDLCILQQPTPSSLRRPSSATKSLCAAPLLQPNPAPYVAAN